MHDDDPNGRTEEMPAVPKPPKSGKRAKAPTEQGAVAEPDAQAPAEVVEGAAPVSAEDDTEAVPAEVAPAPRPSLVERAPLVAIEELSGAEDGKVTPIPSGECLIGRYVEGLTVALPGDQWVSRHHARVTDHDERWWLEDLESSNGTWLDATNQRVTKAVPLELEQIFRVGHTALRLISRAPEHV